MSDNTAILNGYTREIIADSGLDYTLHLFVKPDADLDGSFKAYDADECEWVRVSGWNFTIEDVEPSVDTLCLIAVADALSTNAIAATICNDITDS